jgi:hypothetical protein
MFREVQPGELRLSAIFFMLPSLSFPIQQTQTPHFVLVYWTSLVVDTTLFSYRDNETAKSELQANYISDHTKQ